MEKEAKNKLGALIIIIGVLILGAIAGYGYRNSKADCPEVEKPVECWNCSIFDVNRDNHVDAIDMINAWRYVSDGNYLLMKSIHFKRTNLDDTVYKDYIMHKKINLYAEKLYDVNCDGIADWDDVHLIWENIE